jgi:predicted DsbA family dithiol-disulfide isomerase
VKFRQFPLHPETPTDGLTLEELFRGRNIDIPAAQQRMARLMRDEGLPYGERTMTYNSRLAQELAAWAEQQPDGHKIHDALFRAYFVDGSNIAKIETLLDIAEQVGLPVSAARDVLQSRSCRDLVDADWERAQRMGLTGVPTFVVGNQGVVGAQPYAILEKLVVSCGAKRKFAGGHMNE